MGQLRQDHDDIRTSRKAVCVVDLDTVMPGLSVYDFGDSIRFGANLAAEDETDATKAGLDLEMHLGSPRKKGSGLPSHM